jgi:hypothetical protein
MSPVWPVITFASGFDEETKDLYKYIIKRALKEYTKDLAYDVSSPPIKISLTIGPQLEEGHLAEALKSGFTVAVTNNPSIELSGRASTIAHALAHTLLMRYFEPVDPEHYHKLAWNLVHHAVYSDCRYLRTVTYDDPRKGKGPDGRSSKRPPIRVAYVDIKRLLNEHRARELVMPMPDGMYFV